MRCLRQFDWPSKCCIGSTDGHVLNVTYSHCPVWAIICRAVVDEYVRLMDDAFWFHFESDCIYCRRILMLYAHLFIINAEVVPGLTVNVTGPVMPHAMAATACWTNWNWNRRGRPFVGWILLWYVPANTTGARLIPVIVEYTLFGPQVPLHGRRYQMLQLHKIPESKG